MRLKLRWLDQLIFLCRRILDWRPQSRPSKWTIVLLVVAALIGLAAVLCGVFVLNHVVMAPVSILLGAIASAGFGFPAFRCIQAAIYSRQIEKLLGDGRSVYLMPGAFTHVLIHPALPHDVILVKRGRHAMERFVGQGPRQTPQEEWLVFCELFARRLAARTRRVGKVALRDIKIVLGGNLQMAAIKGEERFVADAKFDEEVEIQIQERGVPLNEYLAKHKNDKDEIYCDFRRTIHRMWKSGFVDLDIAFRNYLVRVDTDGNAVRRNDSLDILVHDFGCIFKLPDQIDEFLEQRGTVGETQQAAVSNGAFLMRSLAGRLEVDFAPNLVPHAEWRDLRQVFNDDENKLPLAKRLKHHSNYKTIRGAHQALVRSISKIVNE